MKVPIDRYEYLSNFPFKLMRAGLIIIGLCLFIYSAPVLLSNYDQVDPVSRTTTVPTEYTTTNGETEYGTFNIQTTTPTTGEVANGSVRIRMQSGWGNPYAPHISEDRPKAPLSVAIIVAPASWRPDRAERDGKLLFNNMSLYKQGQYVTFERVLDMPPSIVPEGIGPTEATLYYYAESNSGTTRFEPLRSYTIYRPFSQRPRTKGLLAAVILLVLIAPTYHPSVQSRLTKLLIYYNNGGLRQDIYSKLRYSKKKLIPIAQTDIATGESEMESPPEDLKIDVDQLRQSATEEITKAREAEARGHYQRAETAYVEAISDLEQAADDAEEEAKEELNVKVEEIQAALNSVRAANHERDSVVNTLQTAERSFNEAIPRYAAGNHTVARIRFRQARDTFEDARQTIIRSDKELLAQPIQLSFEEEATLQSLAIEELGVLEESTVEMLAAADIQSIRDLEADTEEISPPVISDLQHSNKINREEAALLTILSWWYEGDDQEFASEIEISRRYEQADYGFNQST